MNQQGRRDEPDQAVPSIEAVEGASAYIKGVVDGRQRHLDGLGISKFQLIAVNAPYNAGFRAGYFQRAHGTIMSDVEDVSPELPHCVEGAVSQA